ncbi:mariner Mos1 transposase [Trichonephila clavipes]|nr:mariner Mos1 transposase [Trichonephila clavipes]
MKMMAKRAQEHLSEQLNVDQSTVSRHLKAMARNRSYVDPGQPSKSTARPNRFDRKTMLCIFWDQEGPIYYELLKPGKTVYTDRYKQQLLNLNEAILENREQYKKRQHKVIFLDDNAPSHTVLNRQGHRYGARLGALSACSLFAKLGSFRLSPICIIGTRIG